MGKVAEQRTEFASADEIRIVGIVASEATCPLNDGSPGSALYAVPFKLSRVPSPLWANAFIKNWDRPSLFTTMHRPGIARVQGDRIVLDGTTVEEIEKYHKSTLELAVQKANEIEQDSHGRRVQQQAEQDKLHAEHRSHVEDAAKRIKFE